MKNLVHAYAPLVWFALAIMPGQAHAHFADGSMMGGMMWLMILFWLLIVAVLVLTIAALIKYLFGK
ncbi:hypothetical protein GSY71_15015 [Pusillimonas sp. TS35]|uniref:hypothetical protein n=1 Tax=Paracandidimonas lactea TaxID=2895524 RepID=UPI00142516A5|nr:hypothetical protein [Paracandidimonas lactea]MYN14451.1 hypothetical protein [Pusillimonas sp. TS35]